MVVPSKGKPASVIKIADGVRTEQRIRKISKNRVRHADLAGGGILNCEPGAPAAPQRPGRFSAGFIACKLSKSPVAPLRSPALHRFLVYRRRPYAWASQPVRAASILDLHSSSCSTLLPLAHFAVSHLITFRPVFFLLLTSASVSRSTLNGHCGSPPHPPDSPEWPPQAAPAATPSWRP